MDIENAENRFLLCASSNYVNIIFDLETYNTEFHRNKNFKTHSGKSSSQKFTKSSAAQWYPLDSGSFVTAYNNATINLWDTNNLRCVISVPTEKPLNSLHWNENFNTTGQPLIALSINTNQAKIWDPRICQISQTIRRKDLFSKITSLRWMTGSNSLLLTGDNCGNIHAWDIRSAKSYLSKLKNNNTNSITGIKASEDGRYIVVANTSKFISCWDAYTFKYISKKLVYNIPEESSTKPFDICVEGGNLWAFVANGLNYLSLNPFFQHANHLEYETNNMKHHFKEIRSIVYRRSHQQIFTAEKENILMWEPSMNYSALNDEDIKNPLFKDTFSDEEI